MRAVYPGTSVGTDSCHLGGKYMSTISMKISETIEGNCVHTNIQELSELPEFLFKDSLSTIVAFPITKKETIKNKVGHSLVCFLDCNHILWHL